MRVDMRWLGAGLAVSLLANLFLGGAAAGRWLAPRPVVRAPTPGGLVPAARLRALPADERGRFAKAMTPHRPSIRAARADLRAARAQVEADIAAPAYDRTKTLADLARLRQAAAAQQESVHGALAEALAALSPASRAALIAERREVAEAKAVGNAGAVR